MNIKFNHRRLSWVLFLFILSSSTSFLFAVTPPEFEVTFKVTGMVCGGCEAKIESTLKNIRGIHRVEANRKKQKVWVLYDLRTVKVETIMQAIMDLGYSASLVNG